MSPTSLAVETESSAWTLDATHAHVEFAVRHLMISKVKGQFADVAATLRMDGDDVATAQLEVIIGADSIDTRVEQRDQHLRSPDFLDTARFPTLTFRSQEVARVGKDKLQVRGDLTIRDVTREVVLDVTELGTVSDPWGGHRAGYNAETRIDRKDFGLTWNQTLEAGGLLVGDQVDISLDAEFILDSE